MISPGPTFPLARRRPGLFALLILLVFWSAAPRPAEALIEIDITRGNIQPLPIAIPKFVGKRGEEERLGRDIAKVIQDNLARSGLFAPVDEAAFIQKITNFNTTPRFGDWRIINAQALVTGQVRRQNDGQVRVDYRLWDVLAGQQMAGKQYVATEDNWRRIAHIITDAIYQRLTGETGYFDTRVVFVEESGPKDRRVKKLAIMDQDGANLRYLTNGTERVLTPRFSPTTQEVTFMSYGVGDDRPRVYLYNIETGQREIVWDSQTMTFSPRFSPDGRRIVMSLQSGGNSNIYTMDLRSRSTTRLTRSAAIDTAPSYSPDGRQITFESDRGGSQQIYVMNADGSNQRRISFGLGSYSTPVWSPRGDLIAFTKRHGGRFLIGVMRPDGSGERILTEGYHNEGPTWAPNGRVLMFFRETRGASGGPQLWSVDLTGYNERQIQTPFFASDPAWSPLVN